MSETTELPVIDTSAEKLLDPSSQLQYEQERKRKHDEAIKGILQFMFAFIVVAGYFTAFIFLLLAADNLDYCPHDDRCTHKYYYTNLAVVITGSIICGLPFAIVLIWAFGMLLYITYKHTFYPIIDYYYPTELDDNNL